MFEMVSKVPDWFGRIDKHPHVYRVSSYNLDSEKDFILFRNDESEHLKLLFCIDMLNEGIHVDGVSAVVLCRPTVSPIVYKQQVGRAVATGGENRPIIFDFVNNFESLKPIDGLLEEYHLAKRSQNGKDEDAEDPDGFEVIDALKDCRELMDQLHRALDTGWDDFYRAYVSFIEENGTTRVPMRHVTDGGILLGSWLSRQKLLHKRELLAQEKTALLEKLGIDWRSWSDEWFDNILEGIDLSKRYRFWIAKYGKNDGTWANRDDCPKSYAYAWQYTSKGKCPGITGDVDLDLIF